MSLGKHAPQAGAAVRALLSDAIDYAGLFPPAQLDMPGAVAEYASYLDSDDAWALGRFVVHASRLEELVVEGNEHAAAHALTLGSRAWRVSAVFGADIAADVRCIEAFNATSGKDSDVWKARVDAVELRASTAEAIVDAMRLVPGNLERFVEIPIAGDTKPLIRAIRDAHAYAKVRTGGTTADAFPRSDDLARFLATCVADGVPFKATAGLHHPLRGDYPLTYEPGSAAARMYGFMNVFLAAAFLASGMKEGEAVQLLEEHDPSALRLDETGASWRDHRLTAAQVLRSHETSMRSFGSCSFREPIDDLSALGLV